jgi:hypothetical protein
MILVAVAVSQTARTSVFAWRPPLPRQSQARVVSTLIPQVESRIPPRSLIRVEGVGDAFNDAWVGILYGLAQRHQPFLTGDGAAGQKWGPGRRWTGQPVASTVTIASDDSQLSQGPVVACERDRGETLIASWQRLDPGQRQEYAALQQLNADRHGRLSTSQRDRLDQLAARAHRVMVFTGDHVCGS